jgi:hypothetical protein
MAERINKLYKPAELQAAIDALCGNQHRPFSEWDAQQLLKALHRMGWRLVKTEE